MERRYFHSGDRKNVIRTEERERLGSGRNNLGRRAICTRSDFERGAGMHAAAARDLLDLTGSSSYCTILRLSLSLSLFLSSLFEAVFARPRAILRILSLMGSQSANWTIGL